MRRYELVGHRRLRLNEDAPVPRIGPREVLVRVGACTVCNRSDLAYYHYYGLRDHCATGCFGHEIAGTVEAVGDQVVRVEPGRRVFVRTPLTSGFAEYASAREVAVGLLPDTVPYERGAILQLLPLAVHATRGVRLGDRVAIVGQGPVGLMALRVAALRGASEIAVADLDPWRLERSALLGADRRLTVDGSASALAELGEDFDVAIEAVGTPTTAAACVDLVRHNGLVVFLGTHHVDTHVTFDLVKWERKGLRLHTAAEATDTARAEAMRIAERLAASDEKVPLNLLHSDTYALKELPLAIDRLSENPTLFPSAEPGPVTTPPARTLKIAVCPDPD